MTSTTQPSVLAEEIAVEQRHLDRVYARLEQVREQVKEVAVDGHLRASLGNEGALYERDVMVHEAARRLRLLDTEYNGLVFGRLDFAEGVARHIGRIGLRDAEYEPLVVDWRAPAAAPFYRATPEDPMGVVRRRTISSSGTTVTSVSDDLIDPESAPEGLPVVGEGALMATLARARGRAMRDIVATIQREQDEAVRAPSAGVTLIEGGPGTGKTAVALHRVAYLLYTDRWRFGGGGVLLVGPSPAFVRYIEQVLPSLGEEGVALRALGEIIDGVRATRRDDASCAAVKGALRIRRVLTRAVKDAPPEAPRQLRIVYGGMVVILDAAALDAARVEVHRRRKGPVNAARKDAEAVLIAALWNTAMSWADPPEHWERDQFDDAIADRNEFEAFVDRWWPVVSPEDALGWLGDRDRLARNARRDLSQSEVDAVAASLREPGFSVADVALLDELRVLLGPPPRPPARERGEWETQEIQLRADRSAPAKSIDLDAEEEFALIVVDESQDLSPMQWRMLGRRGRHASWTLVGDPAQSSWEDTDEASKARDAAVGVRLRRTFTLTTNYRNSAEIFEFAAATLRRILPTAQLPSAVRPTGNPPNLVHTADIQSALRSEALSLLSTVEGTVGVVTPGARRDEVAGWLSDMDPERLQVVDSLDAKGLEYDGVAVVQPGEIAAEFASGVRVLYVALSRATHRLTVISTDPEWLVGSPPR